MKHCSTVCSTSRRYSKLCVLGAVCLFVCSFFVQNAFASGFLYDGEKCEWPSACKSGLCYRGPENSNYCLRADLNCAKPNSPGIRFGDTYVYNGIEYECRTEVGLVQTTSVLSLPDESHHASVCRSPEIFSALDQCINTVLENKDPTRSLHIKISSGVYSYRGGIMVYKRDDVMISGEKDGSTVLRKLDWISGEKIAIDKAFFISVVDSNRVTIKYLTFDGNGLSGRRGIGVCPTGLTKLSDIEISNNRSFDVRNYFAIVGNAFVDYLDPNGPKGIYLSSSAPARRLQAYLEANPSVTSCSGDVSNLRFANNVLDLWDVGLYLVVHSAKRSKDQVVDENNWHQVAQQLSQKNSNYTVYNNYFRIAGGDPHSVIKTHYVDAMLIEKNTIDAQGFTQAFRRGAAINISAGMQNLVIRENYFKFPKNHRYPERAIAVMSNFGIPHRYYGIGLDLLPPPSLGTVIERNTFENSWVEIMDCCAKEPAETGLPGFCAKLDQQMYQPPFVNQWELLIDDNLIRDEQGRLHPNRDRELVSYRSQNANSIWLEKVVCRSAVKVVP